MENKQEPLILLQFKLGARFNRSKMETTSFITVGEKLTSSFSISLVSGSTSISSWSRADTWTGKHMEELDRQPHQHLDYILSPSLSLRFNGSLP